MSMLKLVKSAQKPCPSSALTMGGPPPERFPKAGPGLTYAQGFARAPEGPHRQALQVVTSRR
ncbi:MAG: hypothetical protein AAF829_02870 [Pseudomonadota bacterium]